MNDICRLGILSDTHLTTLGDALEFSFGLKNGLFAEVDAILHAGDIILPELESCFDDIPFYAVRGNMDPARPGLPVKRVLRFAGFRIGLIHGWGAPDEVPTRVLNEFSGQTLDVLIFGHSHQPFLERRGSLLLFNPGSALEHRGRAERCSVGLLDLGAEAMARHVYL
ncbi:metallophosphoesterase family protein [Geopsychrobacter electrodiphilus]|uniref:metallophosphoesterase family protein n=1 Tax=Geopsychrobacter electrodiphilus TaxID=225196 RepID=UPI0003641082|nr:metallophosphoesterase family protein [Geopsychrobacter electrodiphilus]